MIFTLQSVPKGHIIHHIALVIGAPATILFLGLLTCHNHGSANSSCFIVGRSLNSIRIILLGFKIVNIDMEFYHDANTVDCPNLIFGPPAQVSSDVIGVANRDHIKYNYFTDLSQGGQCTIIISSYCHVMSLSLFKALDPHAINNLKIS